MTLEIKNMTIATRHPVLTNFSYQFQKGNLYGIVATNGSGKTTFFRTVAGLLAPLAGRSSWSCTASHHNRDLFYYETSEWFEGNLSGLDYLRFVKQTWQSSVDIDAVISYWEMEDYAHLPIRQYSLGMKQRVLIAMYMVSDATYLLMDEITNGLDETSRKLFFKALHQLCQEDKMIILTSHYKEDIEEYCHVTLKLVNETMQEVE